VEKGKFVEICFNGKLKNKLVKKVKKGFPLVGRDTGPGKGSKIALGNIFLFFLFVSDCVWYGTVYCDGDVIQDLHRWWFLMKCSNSRLSVYGRSYNEVVSDKRYKKKNG
jgi:hypothetical protein